LEVLTRRLIALLYADAQGNWTVAKHIVSHLASPQHVPQALLTSALRSARLQMALASNFKDLKLED
jgi:hypothetical protein